MNGVEINMCYDQQSSSRSSELFRTMWRINQSMRYFVQKAALENDLSVPQYAVLMMVAPKKEITQKQLGHLMKFPKSTLSQAVDGLVQAGLMMRHPVEDNRREMQLILSEKGKLLYETMREQHGSVHLTLETAIDKLDENQFEEAIGTLNQIATFLGELGEDLKKEESARND